MDVTWATFPMTAEEARGVQAAFAAASGLSAETEVDVGAGVTMTLVLIPPGEFTRRYPVGDPEEAWKEYHVTIERPFYMGRTAVTQGQFEAVMGWNPSRFSDGSDYPVESTPWDACMEFCRRLTQVSGRPFRLPSEAEWEYACRAGSATTYWFGNDAARLVEYGWYGATEEWQAQEEPARLIEYGWVGENVVRQSKPVAKKPANPWRLYDMHGGIDELCLDPWHDTYEGAPTDGSAWTEGGLDTHRVKRGGAWYDRPDYCESGHRSSYDRSKPAEDHGFRVVMEIPR